MERVNKTKAKNLYNKGREIALIPCKCHFGCMMYPTANFYNKNSTHENFEDLCAEFIYYNCNSECGRYLHYYVKEI